jgi:hypothetical protein
MDTDGRFPPFSVCMAEPLPVSLQSLPTQIIYTSLDWRSELYASRA